MLSTIINPSLSPTAAGVHVAPALVLPDAVLDVGAEPRVGGAVHVVAGQRRAHAEVAAAAAPEYLKLYLPNNTRI